MLKSIYNALEHPHLNPYGKLIQKIIFFNIIINITIFMLNFLFNFNDKIESVLSFISTVTVIIFIIELVVRYIVIGQNPKYRGLIGRIKYTFTFYIMIDIISLIPFFATSFSSNMMALRILRFLRFLRILKLLRMKKFIKKFFSINAFASSSITIQIVVLFTLSTMIILLFSYVYKTSDYSVHIFMDPSYITQSSNYIEVFFGIIELIAGLFIGGALISIITSMLVEITNSINNGFLPYKEEGHIIIICYNSKLEFILEEINKFYVENREEQDIVLFLPDISEISSFKKNINRYESLDIKYMAGEMLNWNSYERININKAKKVIMLLSEVENDKNQNRKLARYIVSHPEFNNKDLDFIIETIELDYSQHIYEYIFSNVKNRYTLIDKQDLMVKFLNRSIINYDYFQIFAELLSFDGSEFYELNAGDIFENELSFLEANLRFNSGVLIGYIHNDELKLNPKLSEVIKPEDKVILILENSETYDVMEDIKIPQIERSIQKPKLKEAKKICIVGDYDDISLDKIADFLEEESIKSAQTCVSDDYFDKSVWDGLKNSNVDIIILNLEDEYEFALSLYLKSIYSDDIDFLNKIVNIIHDPMMAKLIEGEDKYKNIILSKKIIGKYIVQVLFNPSTVSIFDEVTQARGNEFYVLKYEDYPELADLCYDELKVVLLRNGMIYLGGFKDNVFLFDLKELECVDRIIVLAQGEIS